MIKKQKNFFRIYDINDTNMKTESRILRGYDVDIPYFSLSGHKVWGATAMILSEFKAILKEAMNA